MFIKKLKNQTGLGLVEVMIAASILGALSLVVMKLNESGTQGVSRVEKGMEIVEFDAEINNYLSTQEGCTNSVGSPTPLLTSFDTNTEKSYLPSIKDKVGTVRFLPNDKRMNVTFKEAYLTAYGVATGSPDFGPGPGNAFLFKIFEFNLSPGKTMTKTKVSTVAITPDNLNTRIASCVIRATKSDSVWSVDAYGISYSTPRTVAIGKTASTALPIALDVQGQVLAGYSNTITGAVTGYDFVIGGTRNLITGTSATYSSIFGSNSSAITGGMIDVIVGGSSNLINGNPSYAAIVGGLTNNVRGTGSAILGGNNNYVEGENSAITGAKDGRVLSAGSGIFAGHYNSIDTIGSDSSAIVGGFTNLITGGVASSNSAIAAGSNNKVLSGYDSAIIGGTLNTVNGNWATLLGGYGNSVGGAQSSVVGGSWNIASGSSSVILGGSGNIALSGGQRGAVIAGRGNTLIGSPFDFSDNVIIAGWGHSLGGFHNALIGGRQNSGIYGLGNAVLGGFYNSVIGSSNNGVNYSTVSGGSYNMITGGATASNNSIVGGSLNILGNAGNSIENSVMVGGMSNVMSDNSSNSVILGGYSNNNDGQNSAIIGGSQNVIQNVAGGIIIGGTQNRVAHRGSMILADNEQACGMSLLGPPSVCAGGARKTLITNAENQLIAKFNGGIKLCTGTVQNSMFPPTPYAGCAAGQEIAAGMSSWSALSDKNMKMDFRKIDEQKFLSIISQLDLTSWLYKSQTHDLRTIGPVAQDFYRLYSNPYHLTSSETRISQSDINAVTLVGVKALEKRSVNLKDENLRLKERVRTLEERIMNIEAKLEKIVK